MEANNRIGIKVAKVPPMKTSTLRFDPRSDDSQNDGALMVRRPLRVCVVFDEQASAHSAEVLITQVTPDVLCDKQTFRFDELNAPKRGVAAARKVADTHILVLAARGDRMLPSHIRLWLGLCLGLRKEGDEGALVALITNVNGCEALHSSILEYLETSAIIGGVAFFSPEPSRAITRELEKKRCQGQTSLYKFWLGLHRILSWQPELPAFAIARSTVLPSKGLATFSR